jgi:hypothetical protein
MDMVSTTLLPDLSAAAVDEHRLMVPLAAAADIVAAAPVERCTDGVFELEPVQHASRRLWIQLPPGDPASEQDSMLSLGLRAPVWT